MTVTLGGNAASNEGTAYVLNIAATGAADPLSYVINWGDGSAVQTLSAADLLALSGNIRHIFDDDEDGPVNATARTISVTAIGGDGSSTVQTKGVTVNNVAPTALVSGANTVTEGTPYTLHVGSDGAQLVSGEQLINTYANGNQDDPEIAVLADGSYVVVWRSGDHQDGSAFGVFGQRFNSSGVPIGSEFLVNTAHTDRTQDNPDVAALSNGGFVIVWSDDGLLGSGRDVAAQIYDATGSTVGNSFVINTTTTDSHLQGVVASFNGGFAVAWTAAPSGVPNDIVLKRYDNSGAVISGEIVISTVPGSPLTEQAGRQHVPSIAAHANGDLIIVWQDAGSHDGSLDGVFGRLYHAASGTFSDTFLVTTTTESYQRAPSVATLSTGGFVVVWTSDDQDGSNDGVYGQRFSATGVKLGGEFLVNETTAGSQNQPTVTGLSDGGFVVGWNYVADVYIREYDSAGSPIDGERKLQSRTNSSEGDVTIADLGDGKFAVVYADVGFVTGVRSGTTPEVVHQVFSYTLDPGTDTINTYSIDWGDGSTDNFTPTQWATANGSFTHSYADGGNGGTARTIVVSATDEDGSFTLGSKNLSVSNAGPTLTLGGNVATNEGSAYALNITATDPAGAADPLSYSINWGDGSAVQTLTAADLLALSGNVSHTFADDEDGPVNATVRTISVTANDGDGGSTVQTKTVHVNNVAPLAAVTGPNSTTAGSIYTLAVGTVFDPGTDTRTGYSIDWGDGTSVNVSPSQWAAALGSFSHTFGSANPTSTIVVRATDEDGTFDLGSQLVTVDTPIRTLQIGDAPTRQSGAGGQWAAAWTDPDVSVAHKADYTNAVQAWSAATFTGVSSQTLAGGDIYTGDLGVSGQSQATSSVRQEIDGQEALRFDLTDPADAATGLTLYLSRLFAQDDGGTFMESGRVRLLDATGTVVGEKLFSADSTSGLKQISLTSNAAFTAIELNAGVYSGTDFIFGGYANANGSFGSAVTTDAGSAKHGSDFMIDAVEFQLAFMGVASTGL